MNSCRNYQTKQKAAIFSLLKEKNYTHMTAEQMLTTLKCEDTPVSKTTLYRFLDTLVESGEVNKYIIDNTSCYQYVGKDSNSQNCFHLICDRCGKMINANNHDMKILDKKIEQSLNFKIDNSKTIIYGTCHECMEKPHE